MDLFQLRLFWMMSNHFRTPFHDMHLELGARMVNFAGWNLPLQYSEGPIKEHHAVRRSVGLFDISHMGRLRLEGQNAVDLLQKVMTRNVSKTRVTSAIYGLITYADGTVVDDVIAVHRGTHWLLVTNGANRFKVLNWLRAHSSNLEVQVTDETQETAMLAVQGPQACKLLSLLFKSDLEAVGRFKSWEGEFLGQDVLLTRTGYTGEDGFELIGQAPECLMLFRELLNAGAAFGIQACGLAARDSLRLEYGYPLYGHELGSTISPLEAGLDWAVSFRKSHFIGREALLKQKLEGPPRLLIGFRMLENGMPRNGYSVHLKNVRLGEVTSGNKSPTLNKFIGLALCTTLHGSLSEIEIDIRGHRRKAEVVAAPFVTSLH